MASQASDPSKLRARTSISDELAIIAQRAQAFTNASGAAIALGEGNADEIVCRARSGASAPDVGVSLRIEGSFTGICIQTGKELRCDDAETDTRVDGAAIRALGIRSMVVTPVKDENKVVGVLAVFAPTSHAFTITHVAVLKTMADQISALLLKERRSRDEGSYSEAQVTAPKPPVAVSVPPPVVIKPANGNSSGAAAAAAPARIVSSPPSKPEPRTDSKVESKPESRFESKVETRHETPRATVHQIPAPVPFPKKEEIKKEETLKTEDKRHEHKRETETAVHKVNFGTFDAVAEENRSSGNSLKLVGAAVVLLVVVGVSWLLLHKGKSEPAAATTAATAPAASQPAASVAANNTPSTSAPSNPAGSASTSSKPAVQQKAESKKPESPSKSDSKKAQDSQPAPAPTPATVALSSGPSRISTAGAQQTQTAEVTPSLAVSGGSSNSLSALAASEGNSKVSMLAHSELENAEVVRRVPAVYPDIAKARRLTGTIDIRIKIGKDGRVSNPRLLSGPAIFRDAAFDAVRQWQYKPAMLNGQPIEQEQEIKMTFHP